MKAQIKTFAVDLSSKLGRELALLDRLHHFLAICMGDEVARLNTAGTAMLGLSSPYDAVGRTFFSFAHPDYAGLADVGLGAFADDGTVVSMKLVKADGGFLDVELWVSRMEGGAADTYLVEAHDITDHLRAAHALRVREQRLQGIINTVADGVITLDEQGVIKTFNPAAEAIFGYGPREMIGCDIRTIISLPGGKGHGFSNTEWMRFLGATDNIEGHRKDGVGIQLEVAVRELYQEGQLSFTGIVRDVSARKKAEQRIFHIAHHDPLTELPNRHLFEDRLDEAFKRAQRNAAKLAVLFIDLDRFKPINDKYGHASGDQVLKQVALRLSSSVRASDTVARLGGDEFIVLLEGMKDREEAMEVRAKLIEAFVAPMSIVVAEVRIGASIGVAVYPDDASDSASLMSFADQAMYRCKRAHKR